MAKDEVVDGFIVRNNSFEWKTDRRLSFHRSALSLNLSDFCVVMRDCSDGTKLYLRDRKLSAAERYKAFMSAFHTPHCWGKLCSKLFLAKIYELIIFGAFLFCWISHVERSEFPLPCCRLVISDIKSEITHTQTRVWMLSPPATSCCLLMLISSREREKSQHESFEFASWWYRSSLQLLRFCDDKRNEFHSQSTWKAIQMKFRDAPLPSETSVMSVK